MAIAGLVWKLASPYDAYVSHVARLDHAIERIRDFSERALGYEAGLQGSVRVVPGAVDVAGRAQRFRDRLATAATQLSDEQFEEFLSMLGGGGVAAVESDRAQAVSRLSHTTRGLEEYFAIAGREIAILERRGYSPRRPDVARQLRENRLPATTVAEYRHLLRTLGARVGQRLPGGE
ncbi:MAG: hypothetical protein IT304_04255 [Dehalococcoidia bacterium]|nr:hypothetical protein [Dehalococcoidia bacterium]